MGFSDAFNYSMVSTPGFWDCSTLLGCLGQLTSALIRCSIRLNPSGSSKGHSGADFLYP